MKVQIFFSRNERTFCMHYQTAQWFIISLDELDILVLQALLPNMHINAGVNTITQSIGSIAAKLYT